MDRIRWDSRLKTGNALIDADHETLIHLFNQVAHAATHKAGRLVCNRILDRLIQHTKAHFEMEERLMIAYNFPNTAEHKAEHAKLIYEALEYKFKYESADVQLPLAEFPRHWATLHMMTSDKEMSDFLATAVRRHAPTESPKFPLPGSGMRPRKARS